nr:hypothetical protein [Tanacetum cinerariifolium]
MQIVTITKEPKDAGTETAKEEPAKATRVVPISSVRPLMRINLELEMMSSPSTVKLTDTFLEILTPDSGAKIEKMKHVELQPKIRIPSLECNKSLPEGVPFINNMVFKEPKYGMFSINVFGDEAFQRMSDINKVVVDVFLTYLVMALNITTPENTNLKLKKLIENYPDQEKLQSKKVKLESVRYKPG